MQLARILIAVVATFTSVSARAQDQFGTESESRDEAVVVCADGLTESSCRLAQSIVRLSLKVLSTSIPGWRVVVVPESQWNEAARVYRVEPSRPAFSALAIHTTYLESSLIFHDSRVNENLQRYTSFTGVHRLTWVIAHEYGHILCGTRDERKASAAAGRLIYGRGSACR